MRRGWRQDGHNGYVWTFSTPNLRYFLRRNRGKAVVDEVLGDDFAGVLVSDFYAAYHHYAGPKQRCWAHLLRDIHDLRSLYPDDGSLSQWADAVHQLYRQATVFTHPAEQQRRTAKMALERRLLVLCRPYLDDPSAAQARLCRRMEKHIKELFVFVAEPEVPAGQQRRRAQPAPSGGQPQGQWGHPLGPGYCHQDDAGVNLRHLAGTRSQHPQRLPSTTRFPSSLNSYSPGFSGQLRRGPAELG